MKIRDGAGGRDSNPYGPSVTISDKGQRVCHSGTSAVCRDLAVSFKNAARGGTTPALKLPERLPEIGCS
jgi:hypothetical protein